MSRLNKDFQEVCEFYVQSLIHSIGEHHDHVDVEELQSIWREIMRPARKHKTRPNVESAPATPTIIDLEFEKRKTQLETMRYDDLYRHCVRNGLQPPNNKEDMVRVILTRMYPS